jgi:hypothetical protein
MRKLVKTFAAAGIVAVSAAVAPTLFAAARNDKAKNAAQQSQMMQGKDQTGNGMGMMKDNGMMTGNGNMMPMMKMMGEMNRMMDNCNKMMESSMNRQHGGKSGGAKGQHSATSRPAAP